MPDSLVGQTIEHYLVLEKLGAGGMGIVYKAQDQKLGRAVALKFLPADLDAPERAQKLFRDEARAASALDHPNIGALHAIEETSGGELFLVMPFYDGETLSQKIQRGPLPAPQALSIAVQIARGLVEAHEHRIVHRDIKPSNVMMTSQGLAKIVDFGLARVAHSAGSTHSLTGVTTSGTAAYMSPEQALGKSVDERTDLWSLGVVIYEMLTGRLPFHGENVPRLLFEIVHSAPAPAGDASVELQQVIYRALAKDPGQRYSSAKEMLADLERIGTPADAVVTRSLSPKEFAKIVEQASRSGFGVTPPARPRRWPWIAAASVATLLAVLAAIPSVRQRVLGLGTPAEKHIAVLPFTAIGADPSNAALADGLLESLTSRLSNLDVGKQSLWVVPASEVRRRKITDVSAAQKEFGANLVITGAVQRQDNLVRLTVNLIDGKNLRQIGSGEFSDRTGDFAAVQDSAVAKLANLMNISVTAEMLKNTGGSVRPVAYESYLKALGFAQRYDKAGNMDQAIKLLESAVAEDPKFALAFNAMADAYLVKYRNDQNPRWLDQASANAKRAVELNDQLAPVYSTLGRILDATGQHDLALEQFQHALKLEPRNTEALFGEAAIYETTGRLKDAEETFRRATALRPDYWDGYAKLGLFYFRRQRFAEAAQALEQVVQLTPDNAEGYSNLGVVYRRMHKVPEAVAAFEKALKMAPSYRFYSNLGVAYIDQANWTGAAQMFQKASELNGADFRVWMNLGLARRWLGQDEGAIQAYTRSLPLLEDMAKRQPQDPSTQSALGGVYARLHQPDKARPRLEAALALAPKDTSVLERAAGANEVMGDRAQAIAFATRALEAGSTLEDLQQNPELRGVLADPRFKPPPNLKKK